MGRRDSPPAAISRRRFLAIGGMGLVAAACGGGNGGSSTRTPDRFFAPEILVADGTPQRSVWGFSDDRGNLADDSPDEVGVEIVDADGNVVATDTARAHRDGVALPYYPVWTTFEEPGSYEYRFTTSAGDYAGFAIVNADTDTTLLRPGDPFPSVTTPTTSDPAGVDPICTRNPRCPFHEVSLDEVLGDGDPVVVLVSSPAFCGVGYLCGPSLELLIEEADTAGPRARIIHSEVYAAPTPQELGAVAPLVGATRATYEPFLFVLDGEGRVMRRLDHIWDRAELVEALSLT